MKQKHAAIGIGLGRKSRLSAAIMLALGGSQAGVYAQEDAGETLE
jgi:hypothetical protein